MKTPLQHQRTTAAIGSLVGTVGSRTVALASAHSHITPLSPLFFPNLSGKPLSRPVSARSRPTTGRGSRPLTGNGQGSRPTSGRSSAKVRKEGQRESDDAGAWCDGGVSYSRHGRTLQRWQRLSLFQTPVSPLYSGTSHVSFATRVRRRGQEQECRPPLASHRCGAKN